MSIKSTFKIIYYNKRICFIVKHCPIKQIKNLEYEYFFFKEKCMEMIDRLFSLFKERNTDIYPDWEIFYVRISAKFN